MGATVSIRRLRKCRYHGGVCYVRQELPDGKLRVVTSDAHLIPSDSGWQQVDKFEWEKTVNATEVHFLEGNHDMTV